MNTTQVCGSAGIAVSHRREESRANSFYHSFHINEKLWFYDDSVTEEISYGGERLRGISEVLYGDSSQFDRWENASDEIRVK